MELPSGTLPLNTFQNGTGLLSDVGILDLLDQDPRPTLIFATTTTSVPSAYMQMTLLAYWNSAMATAFSSGLLDSLRDKSSANSTRTDHGDALMQFQGWALEKKATVNPFPYCNFSWTKVVVANRWNVISGIAIDAATPNGRAKHKRSQSFKRNSKSKLPTFDWTDVLPPLMSSPHIKWARSIDWSQTPLGSLYTLSSQLHSIANLVMQDPRPAICFYGPDLIMIYNEAEVELLGNFHPCMSVSARVALASVWSEYFEPMVAQNLAGKTVEKINTAIHMVRNGFLEETYFSLEFIPILDAEGATVGHYEPLTETVRSLLISVYLVLDIKYHT